MRLRNLITGQIGALALGAMLLASGQADAQESKAAKPESHAHSHGHSSDKSIYKGYFEDSQIEPRSLSDWKGDWQSVYPYLTDGSLDEVMAHKAAHGSKSAEEYRAYYETGYRTEVDRIVIDDGRVSFHSGDTAVEGQYAADGYEILTYKKGNRGVRFIFEKIDGDEAAPAFIQFSDHRIAPAAADHFHLYWGDDRERLLEELTNWPTYFPAEMNAAQIAGAMMAH